MGETMIDNAAYALVAARFKLADCDMPISKEVWLTSPDQAEERRGFREIARAVIASLREPSEHMKRVGARHLYTLPLDDDEISAAGEAFCLMIDAILEEGKT